MSYRAPLTGEIETTITDGHFDVADPIMAAIQVELEELRGDDAHLDGEMRRRLDTQRFPRARARVSQVSLSGGNSYRLTGEITLRGRTMPLEGDADVTLTGERLRATGAVRLDLRDFGIEPASLLMLKVHPEVDISIDLVALAQS